MPTYTPPPKERYTGYITTAEGLERLRMIVGWYTKSKILSETYNRVKKTWRIIIFTDNHSTVAAIKRAMIRSKIPFYDMTLSENLSHPEFERDMNSRKFRPL